MSDTYTKLFSSITASTIVSEPLATRWVWVTMLAAVKPDGCVYASVPGLARLANVSMEEADAALSCFLAPDPHSRTKDHEGRRIEEIDGGWRLLNHAKYDAIRNQAERAQYKRDWDRDHRSSGWQRAKDRSAASPTQSDSPTPIRSKSDSPAASASTSTSTSTSRARSKSREQTCASAQVSSASGAEDSVTPARTLALDGREAPPAYALTIQGGKTHEISVTDLERYERIYPEVDIRRELNRMDAWLHSNPKKRPTHRGAVRFVNSWLTKAIDKAARNGALAFQAARVIDGGVAGRAAARLRAIEGNADGGSLRNDVSDIIAIGPYLSGQFSVAEDR